MSARTPLRYVGGALAFVAALAGGGAALAGWGYLLLSRIVPWVDQQIWVVQLPLKCVLGLTLVFGAMFAWNAARAAWFRFVGAPVRPGERHGRHAKWHPGYSSPAPPAGACPRCGFAHSWDGTRCGHRAYGERHPTNNH